MEVLFAIIFFIGAGVFVSFGIGSPPISLVRHLIPKDPELEWEIYKDEYRWYWAIAYRGKTNSNYEYLRHEAFWEMVKAARRLYYDRPTGRYRGRTIPCVMCGGDTGVGEQFCGNQCSMTYHKALAELNQQREANEQDR